MRLQSERQLAIALGGLADGCSNPGMRPGLRLKRFLPNGRWFLSQPRLVRHQGARLAPRIART